MPWPPPAFVLVPPALVCNTAGASSYAKSVKSGLEVWFEVIQALRNKDSARTKAWMSKRPWELFKHTAGLHCSLALRGIHIGEWWRMSQSQANLWSNLGPTRLCKTIVVRSLVTIASRTTNLQDLWASKHLVIMMCTSQTVTEGWHLPPSGHKKTASKTNGLHFVLAYLALSSNGRLCCSGPAQFGK